MPADPSRQIKVSILAALKQNLLPGFILQGFAVALLFIYFFVAELRFIFSWFGEQKQTYGYGYSFVATAIFGGLIPFLFLLKTGQISARHARFLGCFYVIFWGFKGMEVDFFYRLQGAWFGYANDISTLAVKVAIDQFLYSALWAAPSITLTYLWIEHHCQWRQWWRAMDREFFLLKIPTVIFSNWLVWIPAVSIVYAMPGELQIPLFNLVLCFWVLMLAVLNKKVVPQI